MNELNHSSLLQTLVDDFANNRISFEEYRSQRKIILWQIDEEYNDTKFNTDEVVTDQP